MSEKRLHVSRAPRAWVAPLTEIPEPTRPRRVTVAGARRIIFHRAGIGHFVSEPSHDKETRVGRLPVRLKKRDPVSRARFATSMPKERAVLREFQYLRYGMIGF